MPVRGTWYLRPPGQTRMRYFGDLLREEIPDCDANLGARESGMRSTHPTKTKHETNGLRPLIPSPFLQGSS